MITAALLGMGLDWVTGLAKEHGEDLALEGIKKVTGIDLKDKEPTTEEKAMIIKAKQAILTLDFEKLKLEFEKTKEENRHDEFETGKAVEDRTSARDMFKHGSELQSSQAKAIMSQTKWMIPLYMIGNVGLIYIAETMMLDAAIVVAASNMIGIGIKAALDERQQLNNFLFGAMIAKIRKK